MRYLVWFYGNQVWPKTMMKYIEESQIPEGALVMTLAEIAAFKESHRETWASYNFPVKLENAKNKKCDEIDTKTDNIILNGFIFNNIVFPLTKIKNGVITHDSEINYLGLLTSKDVLPYSGDDRVMVKGKTLTGEVSYFIPESSNELLMFCMTGLMFMKTLLGSGWVLKDQIRQCTTIEAIDNIVDQR